MFKLDNYTKINEEEIPLTKKKSTKKNGNNTRKRKTRRSKNKTSFTGVNSKLKKQIKKFDQHHLSKAISIAKDNNLGRKDVNKKYSNIPKICSNCDNCLISANFCGIFRENCSKLIKGTTNCSFKKPI